MESDPSIDRIGSDRFSGLVKCDKAKQRVDVGAFKVQWHCGFLGKFTVIYRRRSSGKREKKNT